MKVTYFLFICTSVEVPFLSRGWRNPGFVLFFVVLKLKMSTRSEKDKQKQIQDKCQVILGQLLREEDNKYCVDCDAKGPRWASWNLGIFVCIRCAGIHRNLGVHISKVKSVNLDTWTPEQVACLQQMGNSKARAVYEAYLPDNFRRPQTDSSLEQFIRGKYEQKKYIAKEWVPPAVPKPAFDIEEEHKRDRKKKQNKIKGSPAVEIPPPQQPAALPRPHGGPVSSGNSPVASAKLDTQKSAGSSRSDATVDLLGLDIPTVENANEDLFDAFISAAPLSTSNCASSTTSVTHSSAGSSSSNQQNGFSGQPQVSQQPPAPQSSASNDLAGMSERKTVMSKESILSLYSTATNPPPTHQPMFGLQGGMYMYTTQGLQMSWPNPGLGGVVDPLVAQAAAQNAAGNVSQPAVNVTNPFLSMGLSGLMPMGAHSSQVPCHTQLVLDSTAAPNMVVSGQVPLGLGQVQQQMAALQLVNQQWQTGNVMPATMSAFPTSQPGNAPPRPNLQGHTLATNLWQ